MNNFEEMKHEVFHIDSWEERHRNNIARIGITRVTFSREHSGTCSPNLGNIWGTGTLFPCSRNTFGPCSPKLFGEQEHCSHVPETFLGNRNIVPMFPKCYLGNTFPNVPVPQMILETMGTMFLFPK